MFADPSLRRPEPALANLVRIEYFDEKGESFYVEYVRREDFQRPQALPVAAEVLPFRKAA